MIYDKKDNIVLGSLYNDLVTAKIIYKDAVNKINNQVGELLKKYYAGKSFLRKSSDDGSQCIYKVVTMVANFPQCINLYGPVLHIWENGNIDYHTKGVIEINMLPNNVYEDKEISEQEYNDLLTKYGFGGTV